MAIPEDLEKRPGGDDIAVAQASPNMLPVSSSASSELDDSYDIYKQQQSSGDEVDPAEAKRVLRKIDSRIVPILFMIYLLLYLDKNGINYASVYGLNERTKLQGQDYSWLSSIFYFGYMFAQYPAGYLLQRLPIAKVLGFATLGWGVILITTSACTNFASIAANRFLLGAVEATVNPGFVLMMSM